jgi:hypothetical protein
MAQMSDDEAAVATFRQRVILGTVCLMTAAAGAAFFILTAVHMLQNIVSRPTYQGDILHIHAALRFV